MTHWRVLPNTWMSDCDSGLPLCQMCLAAAHRPSRGWGLENRRSANKGKREKGEACLENIEIHPDFLPAKRTGCSVGSRGLRRRKKESRACRLMEGPWLPPAGSPTGAEPEQDVVLGRDRCVGGQTTPSCYILVGPLGQIISSSWLPRSTETIAHISQSWRED